MSNIKKQLDDLFHRQHCALVEGRDLEDRYVNFEQTGEDNPINPDFHAANERIAEFSKSNSKNQQP